jgi:hypothetical protein
LDVLLKIISDGLGVAKILERIRNFVTEFLCNPEKVVNSMTAGQNNRRMTVKGVLIHPEFL